MTLANNFKAYIKEYNGEVLTDEPLKNHCTFKTGGPAEVLYIPHNEKALIAAVTFANDTGCDLHILGNGSNVLISDKGLLGLTIKLSDGLCDLIYLGENVIGCSAGVSLIRLCRFALERSLSGLEFAYGIPGSVGGAVYMNAGAYGGEIKSALLSVRSIDSKTYNICEQPIEELDFSYRSTPFMKNSRIITSAYFKLTPANKDDIQDKMNELMAKRRQTQPLEYPSAGSTFKRPVNGYAAAHIEQCGLKGFSHGGAEVSTKHAGFVINTSNATSEDIFCLMNEIQQRVFYEHGIMLEPEVELLGFN